MLAAARRAVRLEHLVDRVPEGGDRAVQPAPLLLGVLGDHVADDDLRLVQHRGADGETVDQLDAVDAPRERGVAAEFVQLVAPDQLIRADQLGQHHGDGLQRLDLFLVVVAARAVLHRQHADHAAAAQDGHAEQRVEDLLAGLGPVREVGVRLGVGQVQQPGLRGDASDEALADPEPGAVHRVAVEALGGEQLEQLPGAHEVHRAHLGHQVAGDDRNDLVEPLLGRGRRRHDLAQPAQQRARAARARGGRGQRSSPRRRRAGRVRRPRSWDYRASRP